MLSDDRDKLNKIDRLKGKLFNRGYETKVEYHDDFVVRKKKDVPDSWQGTGMVSKHVNNFFMQSTIFKNFFIFSLIIFACSIAYVSYVYFAGNNTVSNDNIDISILGNTFTNGGEDLPLQIEIANKNNSRLDLVDLVIEYPKGSSSDQTQDTERLRTSLGTIAAGAVRDENVKVVLFGEQGSRHLIKISIEYRVEGSNAIFVKEKPYEVTINTTPINLLVEAPAEVSPNQDISFKVITTLNAAKPIPNMAMKLDYPVGFQFISAKPAPSFGNNVWDLSKLAPGVDQNVEVIGRMVDVFDNEEKTFHVYSGLQADTDKSEISVVFNSLGHIVLIKKPFIEAKLLVNGSYERDYSISPRSLIQNTVSWKNNLDTKVNDLSIFVKITGNAFDRKSVNPNQGFYKSLEDTIVWDKNSEADFREVNPGESGIVTFSMKPLSVFLANGDLLRDPSINIEVSISGKQAVEGDILQELHNSESKVLKVISDVGFTNKLVYYTGPFQNTGPIPPKAENETTYTVTWSISNTVSNLSRVQVRSSLPQWVRFTGVFVPSGEDITYNSATKEIVWNAGAVPRGTGITNGEKEVSFQVAFVPSLAQVGTLPTIINGATLTGHDDFANVDLSVNRNSLDTRVINDTGFPSSGFRVVD